MHVVAHATTSAYPDHSGSLLFDGSDALHFAPNAQLAMQMYYKEPWTVMRPFTQKPATLYSLLSPTHK